MTYGDFIRFISKKDAAFVNLRRFFWYSDVFFLLLHQNRNHNKEQNGDFMTDDTNNIETTEGNLKLRQKQLIDHAENDQAAIFHADNSSAGQQQQAAVTCCPNCGTEMDIDADYCESCHIYVKREICSFCGAHLTGMEGFCPECGNPLGGLVCPVCHTMNDFAFCKQCGTPLTDEAKEMQHQLHNTPEYRKLSMLVKEMGELEKIIPYTSEREIEKEKQNNELRKRVLTLLAEDMGNSHPVIEERKSKRTTIENLKRQKTEVQLNLSKALSKLETNPTVKPSQARNYAMATKPAGVRLGWVCNYKHALHSSPCGCAKPQMGGKWVVLGKRDADQIKDDK